MAELRNYMVKRGHIYAPRVACPEGEVLALDPEDANTRRGVGTGQLELTDAKPTAELVDMGLRGVQVLQEDDDSTAETISDVEAAAAELVELKVDDLAQAAREASEEVLVKAMELEVAKGESARKGAVDAITAALEAGAAE